MPCGPVRAVSGPCREESSTVMRPTGPTVVRVFHGGLDGGQHGRDHALAAAGARVVLVVPRHWPSVGQTEPGPTGMGVAAAAGVEIVEVDVGRAGDINRHRHLETGRLASVLARVRPDLLDVHEEPVSIAMRQFLRIAPAGLPVVGYTAQNLDKRFPPPYAQFERSALARLSGLYPCSRQAASVVWGKGFRGHLDVLPLGYDAALFEPGDQSSTLAGPLLVLAGRLVPQKGVRDAVAVLAAIRRRIPARLVLVGNGPELEAARAAAHAAGVGNALTHRPWLDLAELAALYRQAHVVLAPSRRIGRWVEQFGRMVTEAQASGAVVCGYATGSLPEVGGQAALLVAEGDTRALADAVVALVTDVDAWTRHSALGQAQVRQRSWPAVARAEIDFYDKVLGQPRRSRLAVPDDASRGQARERYGPPATVGNQPRPFAVPVLRDLGAAGVGLGRLVDAVAAGGRRTAQRVRERVSDR